MDVFHTFFGLTAFSLMGHYDLELIDNTYAIPVETIKVHFPHIYNKGTNKNDKDNDNKIAEENNI